MSMSQAKRRYPIGAELIGENQTHFRVWAPKAREVDVVLEDAAEAKPKFCSLTAESGGYFSGAANAGSGARYRFRVEWSGEFLSRSGVAFSTRWAARIFVHCGSDKIPMERRGLARIETKRPDLLRDAHRHVHQGRNVARRCRTVTRAGAHRNHGDRNDAGRGVPRQIWLGLRRR